MKNQIKKTTKKGGKVENKAIELEVVKTIDNPMAEYETLDEKEQGIVDAVKKSVRSLKDILQMKLINEKEKGRMVGAHIIMPIIVHAGVSTQELANLSLELNATVAVSHDDVSKQLAIIISWG